MLGSAFADEFDVMTLGNYEYGKDYQSLYEVCGKDITIADVIEDPETGFAYIEYNGEMVELGMDFLSMAMVYNTQPAGDYATEDDVYAAWWRMYITRWNYLLPEVPLYSNEYYDLYNAQIKGVQEYPTNPYWSPANALIDWTSEKEDGSIILGNSTFADRKKLIHFFDGFTSLMQVLIFFMLGLLARPAMLHKAILPAFAIFLFMLVMARPASVNAVLTFFRKGGRYNLRQQALISFVGLRGAASIVFAIMAIGGLDSAPEHDIFNIVFCLVLLSISIQGTLIPFVARRLDMIDVDEDVMKTFNDFQDNTNAQFSRVDLTEDSLWNGKQIKELGLPRNILIVMVMRGKQRITPRGNTRLTAGDRVVLITKTFEDSGTYLEEHTIRSKWQGKSIKEYDRPGRGIIVMVRRGENNIIPNGNTVLETGDVVVLCRTSNTLEE